MGPVVICIELDTYAAAVAALEMLADRVLPLERLRCLEAVADLRRAMAQHVLSTQQSYLPALLRRQAE